MNQKLTTAKFYVTGMILGVWAMVASAQTTTNNYSYTFAPNQTVPDDNFSGVALTANLTGMSGFIANNAMVPRTKSAVVLLSNGDHVPTGALHATILGLLLKDQAEKDGPSVPKVNGPHAKGAALDFLHQMQAGKIERHKLGEEFSVFLTDERVKDAAPRLKALGEPEAVEVRSVAERGGMEVAVIRLTFKSTTLGGLLYRSPDGKIQQLLFHKE